MTKILVAIGLFCSSSCVLFGDSLIVGVNGGANAFPFGRAVGGGSGTRYQEAYDKSLFPGAMSITGIEFFRANAGALYSGTFTLSFSTITAGVSSLSDTDFNGNLGPGNTVFDVVALSGAAPSMLIFTGGPFFYDPALGNLLLDIQIAGPVNGTASFQDGNGTGPTTIDRYHNFSTSTSSTGFGLRTQFDYTPVSAVPEPATFGLLSCGLIGILAWRAQRPKGA